MSAMVGKFFIVKIMVTIQLTRDFIQSFKEFRIKFCDALIIG